MQPAPSGATKKIIHLSDLHIGYPDLAGRFNCIINAIILQKQPAHRYVIVITGDLVEDGFSDAYYAQARTLIGRLRDAGYTVLAVPGNHDYGSGLFGSEEKVATFKKVFFARARTRMQYPKKDILGNIAFLGLDSMAEELHWYDCLWANGELGGAQLDRLRDMLQDKDVEECAERVVYLHHHPFDPLPFHELKDADKLRKVLEHAKISALLYGHNHQGKIRNGTWGIPRCYDGGTATAKDGDPHFHRVIDFARDPRNDYDAAFDLR
jgi:3',5'-cyclic AMP phosphodiesterase CpdA